MKEERLQMIPPRSTLEADRRQRQMCIRDSKQPNPMPTRTGGTTTKTAQSKQNDGNNQDQSRVKRHRD